MLRGKAAIMAVIILTALIVAYHWRKIPGSTAEDYRAKPRADVAARAALADALARAGERGTVESGLHEGTFRPRGLIPLPCA